MPKIVRGFSLVEEKEPLWFNRTERRKLLEAHIKNFVNSSSSFGIVYNTGRTYKDGNSLYQSIKNILIRGEYKVKCWHNDKLGNVVYLYRNSKDLERLWRWATPSEIKAIAKYDRTKIARFTLAEKLRELLGDQQPFEV